MVKLTQILITLLLCLSSQLQAQDETLRVDSSLVSVPCLVIDRGGRYVTDLKKEDFEIFEDGVKQEIRHFRPMEERISVLLLLDVSGSMGFDINLVADSANRFIKKLRPTDRLSVAAFSDYYDQMFGFMPVEEVLGKKRLRLLVNGRPPQTMVYDAVETALKRIAPVNGRKAIVMLSDGIGTGYSAGAKSNLRDAEEQEALIYSFNFDSNAYYPVRLKTESEQRFRERNKNAEFAKGYMNSLATKTGGRYFNIKQIEDLDSVFDQVANELGRQYTLMYEPAIEGRAGERRKITVKVNVPNVAVRSRNEVVFRKGNK
ncbi:MAG: VWA domain-containing protein [Pyrinomonadaceae bacterium]|nr:VWA domain-containing protein [Acidobacteriota bacterium]MBP7475149.1 VWA domain-containing protein [Pyrinomonadaceae bacterium]MBP9110469.1 VWA domain-containing protein [Pyrinomonadaceae bacterium]